MTNLTKVLFAALLLLAASGCASKSGTKLEKSPCACDRVIIHAG